MATVTSLGFNITSDWDGDGVRAARADLKLLNEDLRRVSNTTIRVDVRVDDAQARAQIRQLDNDTRNRATEIKVTADTAKAEAMIDRAARNRTARIDIDRDGLNATLQSVSSTVTELVGTVGRLGGTFAGVGSSAAGAGGQIGSMGATGGVAMSALGTSASVVTGALGTVAVAFAGVTIAAELAGAAGAAMGAVTAAAVATVPVALAAWPLAFQSVRDRMGPMFQGLKDNVESFANKITTELTPAWNVLAGAASSAFDAIKPALNEITPMLDSLIRDVSAQLGPAFTAFGGTLKAAMDVGGDALRSFANSWAPFADSLTRFFQSFSNDIYFTDVFIPTMMRELGRLIEIIGKLTNMLLPLGSSFMTSFNDILNAALPVLQSLMGPLDRVIEAVGRFLTQAFTDLGPPISQIVTLISDLLVGTLDSLSPLLKTVGDAFNRVYTAMQPMIPVLVDLVGIIANQLADFIPVIADVAVQFLQALIPAMRPLVDVLRQMQPYLTAAAQQLGFAMVEALRTITPYLPQLVKSFGDFAIALIPLLPRLMELAVKLMPMLIDNFIKYAPLGIRMITGFANLADKAAQVSGWFLKLAGALINWKQEVKQFIEGLGEKWRIFWDTFSAVVSTAWQKIKDLFARAVGAVITKVAEFRADLTNRWNALWDGISQKVSDIWNGIQLRWDQFTAKIRSIFDGFKNALQSAWNAFWDAVSNKASDIWGAIQRGWDAFTGKIREIFEGFKNALSAAWSAFWDSVSRKAGEIWDGIKQRWGQFTGAISGAFDTFKNALSGAWSTFWDGLKNKAAEIWDGIVRKFNEIKDSIVQTFHDLVDMVGRIWDGIVSKFQGPVDTIKNIWGTVAGIFGLSSGGEAGGGAPIQRAHGGAVFGAGTATSDSIPAYLSNGEHVWTAAEVDAAGGQSAVYNMRASVLARKGVRADDNTFAGGGAVDRLDAAAAMARDKGDGRAYVYGGSGPDGFDCSGYMSAIYNVLQGSSNWWQRQFSTESDFGGLGFRSGLGAGFSVGIHRGGGGPNSHMAGTLNGVNVESGGAHNSTRYGGPAAGADSGQFELKYFLPIVNGQFVSGGAGGGYGGPTPEQVAAAQKAIADITAVVNSTNVESATKRWGMTIHEMNRAANPGFIGPVSATELVPSARAKFGAYAPAGDVPASGTFKSGDGGIKKIESLLASARGGFGGEIPTGDRARIIADAMGLTSTPPPSTRDAWLAGMNTLITRESNWNPNAINNYDSNAAAGNSSRGLAQVIPTTFDAYKVAGHDDIWAPVDNVAASINYIKARYGSIENVQQANANMPPAGYLEGTRSALAGWHMVGEAGPEMVNFRGGEQVKSFNDIIAALQSGGTDIASRVTLGVQDAIERAGNLGVTVNVEIKVDGAGDVAGVVNRVQAELLPKLEMALRQQVGVRA